MASGRMEFHAYSIMQHANFTFAIANDVPMEEVRDLRHYERETHNLILLHGLSGTDTDWLYGGLAQNVSIQFNLNVFMPTAGNSFYLDKGYPGGNWCEYIGSELIEYLSRTFRIEMNRDNTIIGGLSMGGFGAVHTALAYPENFGACIGLSSAMIMHEYAESKNHAADVIPEKMLYELFGERDKILASDINPETLFLRLKQSGAAVPKIYLACGTEDSLIGHNREFAAFLKENGADCVFEEGPGMHDWKFWNEYLNRGLDKLL